jgi:hypothetical protein
MAFPRIVVEDATGELLQTNGEVAFGTRVGNEVVVDDPIAADRHCQFGHDGAFAVRDLGSVTGTWLDGERVTSWREVKDGSQVVFGASRVLAKIEDRDGAPTLVLQLQRASFWWRKAGKKVFDNDPDALVREEVGFGRFAALRAGNRTALVLAAVLLVAGTFVGAVMEPLADAGPLLPAHAFVHGDAPLVAASEALSRCRAIAEQQGCDACHETGAGTPARKCEQCHGDLVAEATRRHPYTGDGQLASLPGLAVDDGFCTVCHRDHAGSDWLKPAAKDLVGACDRCHGPEQRAEVLAARVPPPAVTLRDRAVSTVRFPHGPHVQKGIDCAVCHQADADVRARRAAGQPDDPRRDDFTEVRYETCAACHVPGAAAAGLTAAQQQQWRATEHQWPVTWHGTDDPNGKCAACHAREQRDGRDVLGPSLRTVVRPVLTAAQHAAERARYTVARRSHREQFEAHAAGRECTQCHLAGTITAASAMPSPRAFWHALHVADGALAPAPGQGGAISADATAGCVSCHGDLRASTSLRDATVAAYHWPAPGNEQACGACHRDGASALAPRAETATIAADRREGPAARRPDFPHDVHVAAFGRSPVLADGCFACHTFEAPAVDQPLFAVPRTKPEAADCSACHAGHDHVGGGACRQCHPADAGSNSFLAAAAVPPGTPLRARAAPAAPTRRWPNETPFSHFSPGHVADGITCATCHDATGTGAAQDLATVPVPDDSAPACRDCHLKKQFHWR